MTKNDIVRKLTSRKFWMAVALFISGLMTALGEPKDKTEVIAGLIMQGAAVVAYIIGEGLADASTDENYIEVYMPEECE